MYLFNTFSRTIEEFTPIHPPTVGIYTCGITAYDYSHIGHGRKYVSDDILRRTLMHFGYGVTHVQNVTDVGHLSSDADEGEDKMEKGAKKSGKTVWEVAKFYEDDFYASMKTLNILTPTIISRATEHIPEQIQLIQRLFTKGHAYETEEAVYFDITTFPDYGTLFGQSLDEKRVAVRSDVQTGEHKRNPADFALWFKRTGRFADHAMHWDSPWGDGFPGWHIECSAMSMKYLGESFDIHTGGEDHISIHHPNEIAQSEGATGKKFVRYWVHNSFLLVDGHKMSKSLQNFYRVQDIINKGIDPLALRYFYLTAHYRKPQNFTWEALSAAQNALAELKRYAQSILRHKDREERNQLSEEKLTKADDYMKRFDEALSNDINMPQALAIVWETVKSNIPASDKYDLVASFDQVLGLNLFISEKTEAIPAEIDTLIKQREAFRQKNMYQEADSIRKIITDKGYTVKDTGDGVVVEKLSTSN